VQHITAECVDEAKESYRIGLLWRQTDARCLDTEAGMGGYPGLRCVTTLTESIVEGPVHSPLMRRGSYPPSDGQSIEKTMAAVEMSSSPWSIALEQSGIGPAANVGVRVECP
jgi:hypothetical protein